MISVNPPFGQPCYAHRNTTGRRITDKTVGNTAVGVLAHTVPYHMPYSLSCYVVGSVGPRTASNNAHHATGGKLLYLDWRLDYSLFSRVIESMAMVMLHLPNHFFATTRDE